MIPLTAVLNAAQVVAIERLVQIVRESPSEREARLAAVALLRMSVEPPAAAEQPAPAPQPAPAADPAPARDQPLTTAELEALRRLLPHVRPERFVRRPPAHWRTILAQHARPAALRQAG